MSKNKTHLRNAGYSAFSLAFPLLLAVFLVPVTIRGLGAERFGLLALLWVIIRWTAAPAQGITQSLIRNVSGAAADGGPVKAAELARAAFLLQIPAAALTAFLAHFLLRTMASHLISIPPRLLPETNAAFSVFPYFIFLYLLTSAVSGFFEAAGKFRASAAIRVASESGYLLAGCLCAGLGLGLESFSLLIASAQALIFAAASLRLRILAPQVFTPAFPSAVAFRAITNFAMPASAYKFFGVLAEEADSLLLGVLSPLTAVAHYNVPRKILKAIGTIASGISIASFPVLSRLSVSDRRRFPEYLASALGAALLLPGALYLAAGLTGRKIISVWIGPEFAAAAAPLLLLMAPGALCQGLIYILGGALQNLGSLNRLVAAQAGLAAIYLCLGFALIPRYGIKGAALAWSFKSLAGLAVYLALCARALRGQNMSFGAAQQWPALLNALIGRAASRAEGSA